MNIYMICTLWTPFQAERDWKNSYREILLIPLYIFYSLWIKVCQSIFLEKFWPKYLFAFKWNRFRWNMGKIILLYIGHYTVFWYFYFKGTVSINSIDTIDRLTCPIHNGYSQKLCLSTYVCFLNLNSQNVYQMMVSKVSKRDRPAV